MGFQSIHIFAVKWTCSVIRTGGISCRKSFTILVVYQFMLKAVVSGPWRRKGESALITKIGMCY